MENTNVEVVPANELPTQNSDRKFIIEMADLNADVLSFERSMQKMKENKLKKSAFNVATQYFDFQQGVTQTFMFLGITRMTTQDGEVMPAIMFMDDKNNTYINQAKILVDAVIKAEVNIFQWFDATWTGTKKTGKGNQIRTWSVFPYNEEN